MRHPSAGVGLCTRCRLLGLPCSKLDYSGSGRGAPWRRGGPYCIGTPPHAPRGTRRYRWRGLDGVRAGRGGRRECVQIFTRNARGWAAKPLEPDEVARFRAEAEADRLPGRRARRYLVNAAAADRGDPEEELGRARGRARALRGARRPRAHLPPRQQRRRGRGDRARRRGMDAGARARAGQGAAAHRDDRRPGGSLGWRFEQLAAIREAVPGAARRRVGVCLDTCHVFAAGYDLSTARATRGPWRSSTGPSASRNVQAFHLNDSKRPLGSRVDRHEHIGAGRARARALPAPGERRRFADRPGFLETEERYPENLAVLRRLVRHEGDRQPKTSRAVRRAGRRRAAAPPACRSTALRRATRAKLDRLVAVRRGGTARAHPDPRQPGPRLASPPGVALAWLLEQLAGVEARWPTAASSAAPRTGRSSRCCTSPSCPVSRVAFDELRPDLHGRHPARAGEPLAARRATCRTSSSTTTRPARDRARALRRRGRPHRRHLDGGGRVRAGERPRAPAAHRHRALLRDQGRHPRPRQADHAAGRRRLPLALPAGGQGRARGDRAPAPARGLLPAVPHRPSSGRRSTATRWCADLGEIYAPDMVAEVAERFISSRGRAGRWRSARYEDDALVLAADERPAHQRRPAHPRGDRGRGGWAGGHGTMAGARLPVEGLR